MPHSKWSIYDIDTCRIHVKKKIAINEINKIIQHQPSTPCSKWNALTIGLRHTQNILIQIRWLQKLSYAKYSTLETIVNWKNTWINLHSSFSLSRDKVKSFASKLIDSCMHCNDTCSTRVCKFYFRSASVGKKRHAVSFGRNRIRTGFVISD